MIIIKSFDLGTKKKEDYEEKQKEILQFYNNEKSHDFNEDILRTQLRMFSADLKFV